MQVENNPLLYIDDEPQSVKTFKSGFQEKYNIKISSQIDDIKSILHDQSIKVVVADCDVLERLGIDSLEEIRENQIYTEWIIMLRDFSDVSHQEFFQKKGNYRFIKKPWDKAELLLCIESAYRAAEMFNEILERSQELRIEFDELDRFVYSASHDLMAPLTSIEGLVNIAQKDPAGKDRYLSLIQNSILRLRTFIENIIFYNKNKYLEPVAETIHFKEFLEEIVETFQFYHGREKINITVTAEQDHSLSTDKERLKIIINNLLSNAIKYSDYNKEKPYIKISASVRENKAILTMKDNGIGISEENQKQIFNMFFRVPTRISGSGIGLYIVKEVVKKLNGELSVESKVGAGTKFKIIIPEKKPVNT